VMQYMGASISLALSASSFAQFNRPTLEKILTIIAGYGWGQLTVFSSLILHGLNSLVVKTAVSSGWGVTNLKSLSKAFTPGPDSIIPLELAIALLFLILPEPIFLLSIPFVSPKYILVSSSIIAGICAVVPMKLFGVSKMEEPRPIFSKKVAQAALGIALLLPITSGLIKLGEINTADGLRHIGGWIVRPIPPHPDVVKAKELVSCLAENRTQEKRNIVVNISSWTMEEVIAYESASREWQNRVVPVSVMKMNSAGDPVLYSSLNEYLVPGEPPSSIFVAGSHDIRAYGEEFTDSIFKAVAGGDFRYYNEVVCLPR